MITTTEKIISAEVIIDAPIDKVWQLWTDPKHIIRWNYASEDWHTTWAENDFRAGGRFLSRMESRDGKHGFDFTGEYKTIEPEKLIEYTLDDGRQVEVTFISNGQKTKIRELFEAELSNPKEMQQAGWQSILDNFKKYVEEESEKFNLMHFEILINANAEKVYKTMIDEEYFSEWTSEFNPSSYYIGSWDKGSEIKFLGVDKDGNKEGMFAVIKENIPNKFVSIEYFGIIQNENVITSGEEIDGWAGALENYTFTEQNGKTLVEVDIDVNFRFISYFTESWPRALNKLKSICQENS
jgi:uncharacterized protein YndB with AHSA1/START domain